MHQKACKVMTNGDHERQTFSIPSSHKVVYSFYSTQLITAFFLISKFSQKLLNMLGCKYNIMASL